jgi:predicted CoA-binding protein
MEPVFRAWYERKMLATPELVAETEFVGQLLKKIKRIAIVGISKDQHRDSHYVGRYLKHVGYEIIPVNPGCETILGEPCYPNLKTIPLTVDAVDIFRKPSDILEVVNQAIEIGAKVIWLQLGTGTHPEAKRRAEDAGCIFIQNRCMKVDHQFLIRTPPYQTHNNQTQGGSHEHQRQETQLQV